jgi:hypothetical protein
MLLISVLVSCAHTPNDKEINELKVAEIIENTGPIDFAKFNVKNKNLKGLSGLEVALKFVNAEVDYSSGIITYLSTPERFDDLRVTIEKEGLMDDSIEAEKYFVELKKEKTVWKITKALKAWKCARTESKIYDTKICP